MLVLFACRFKVRAPSAHCLLGHITKIGILGQIGLDNAAARKGGVQPLRPHAFLADSADFAEVALGFLGVKKPNQKINIRRIRRILRHSGD